MKKIIYLITVFIFMSVQKIISQEIENTSHDSIIVSPAEAIIDFKCPTYQEEKGFILYDNHIEHPLSGVLSCRIRFDTIPNYPDSLLINNMELRLIKLSYVDMWGEQQKLFFFLDDDAEMSDAWYLYLEELRNQIAQCVFFVRKIHKEDFLFLGSHFTWRFTVYPR